MNQIIKNIINRTIIFLFITIFVLLISFVKSEEIPVELSNLNNLINESNSINKIYYLESNKYWKEFVSERTISMEIYDNMNSKEQITSEDIEQIISQTQKLKDKLEIIRGIIELDKSFADRKSPAGFEGVINQNSINGDSRIRIFFTPEDSSVKLLMSTKLQSQNLVTGTSGLGLKTGIVNVISTNFAYQIKSAGKTVNLYDSNGNKKSNSVLQDEAQSIALNWAGISNALAALFTKYNVLNGKIKDFTIIGKTSSGTLFERTYQFMFINAKVETFNTTIKYYCYFSNLYECNKIFFYDWDNSLIKTEYPSKGSSSTFEPNREGYNFLGWNNSVSNVLSNIETYAQYEIKKFNVTFKNYNGSILSTQIVEYGQSATEPEIPTRENYNFIKWNDSFENIKKDIEITAQFRQMDLTSEILINSSENTINLTSENFGILLNLTSLINSTTKSGTIPEINITFPNISISIPKNNVSSTSNWDESIIFPNNPTASLPSTQLIQRNVSTVILIGSSTTSLLFSNAIRIEFIGEKNKEVGYFNSDEVFNKITNQCSIDDQNWANTNLTIGDCYLHNGNNTIIWTKHLTKFVTYTETTIDISTPTPVSVPTTSGGISKSSSSSKSTSKNTEPTWNCSEWSICTNKFQTRACNCIKNCLTSSKSTPILSIECNEPNQQEEIIVIKTPTTGNSIKKSNEVFNLSDNIELIIFIAIAIITLLSIFLLYYTLLKKTNNQPKVSSPQKVELQDHEY